MSLAPVFVRKLAKRSPRFTLTPDVAARRWLAGGDAPAGGGPTGGLLRPGDAAEAVC